MDSGHSMLWINLWLSREDVGAVSVLAGPSGVAPGTPRLRSSQIELGINSPIFLAPHPQALPLVHT